MSDVQDKGEMVMRAYTPTSCDDDVGHFDLVVKVYFANNNPAFPLVGPHHSVQNLTEDCSTDLAMCAHITAHKAFL